MRIGFVVVTLSCLVAAVRAEDRTVPGRPLIAADYQKKVLALVGADGEVRWRRRIRDLHDLHVLSNGNILCQSSWTEVHEIDPRTDAVVWTYDAAKMNGNEGRRVEVHAFQRLKDGSTMIAESGPARIIEVDREGKVLREVKLKVDSPDPHRDTRLVRKLKSGNYLVCHEKDACVREYSSSGEVVWERRVGSAVYSATRLENGNTLIGCGDGHRVIEVDPKGEIVWKVEENDLEGVRLAWVTSVERLPGGTTLIVNCHAGPENPQIVEISKDKKIVWSYRDFELFGNALPMARVLGPVEKATDAGD